MTHTLTTTSEPADITNRARFTPLVAMDFQRVMKNHIRTTITDRNKAHTSSQVLTEEKTTVEAVMEMDIVILRSCRATVLTRNIIKPK